MSGSAGTSTTMTSLLDLIGGDNFSRRLLDQLAETVTVTDLKGRILYVNECCSRKIGRTPDELIGESVEVYGADEEGRAAQREILATTLAKGEWIGQVINVDREGRKYWVECRTFMVRDEAGEPIALCGVGRDVTERREAETRQSQIEAQLLQAQKLESIGTLAGGVAHEINNPIQGIMNYAQLMLDRCPENAFVAECAMEIKKETVRVAGIVRSLLQFSRADHAVAETTQVATLIEGVSNLTRMLMRHDHIRMELDVSDDLPDVSCQIQQIQQVLMNLLTNARDALNERYEGYDDNKIVRLSAETFLRDGRSWVRVSVRDHGTGISLAVRDRIMDPFFTTKPRDKGTGLGLSISHGILKEHGGMLRWETEPGVYTCFHVELLAVAGPTGPEPTS